MKKSPLNNAFTAATNVWSGGSRGEDSTENFPVMEMPGSIAEAAQAIQGGIKTQSLRDTPNALGGEEAVTKHESVYKHIKKDVNPSYETAVQGNIMQSTGGVTQSAYEKPLGEVFEDGAKVAAENMFGATVPGNFGRSMGG